MASLACNYGLCRITARLTLPANVHALPTAEQEAVRFDHLRVAKRARTRVRPAGRDTQPGGRIPPPVAGFFNVGVLHTALDGQRGHAPYAPCMVNG